MEKGKREFTRQEYEEIRKLVSQLETADSDKKKNIRSKIRNKGLYWSEIAGNIPYTLTNLESLLKSGVIKIIGSKKEVSPSSVNKLDIQENKRDSHKKETEKKRIFISYKRIDKDKVFPIKERIEKSLGDVCWIDIDGIESDAQFVSVIIKAIEDCDIFLFMYSKTHEEIKNFEKDWTIRELQFAEQLNKRIVFVNIDRSELARWFSFMFGQKQQVDALSENALERLICDLKNWLTISSQESKYLHKDTKVKLEDDSNLKEDSQSLVSKDDKKENLEETDKIPLLNKKKKSKAFKPKESDEDKDVFNLLNDSFPPKDYAYDYIVSGLTIKKKLPDSKKIGVISFSECKREEDGTVVGNLYFLPMGKHTEILRKKNIEFSVAWNGVPFVRNVTIEEGKKIINNLFEDLEFIISKKKGDNNSMSINSSDDSKTEKEVEIRDIKFSIKENDLEIQVTIFSSVKLGQTSVRILLGNRYFINFDNINKNKTKNINFLIKAKNLYLNSGEITDCNFIVQVLEDGEVICEKNKGIKLYYEKHLFSKNTLEIKQ